MERTLGSERAARESAGARPAAPGSGHPDGDENDAGDPVPLPADLARPQRARLHEGGDTVLAR